MGGPTDGEVNVKSHAEGGEEKAGWGSATWELGGRDDGGGEIDPGRSESSILFVCAFFFPGRCRGSAQFFVAYCMYMY